MPKSYLANLVHHAGFEYNGAQDIDPNRFDWWDKPAARVARQIVAETSGRV